MRIKYIPWGQNKNVFFVEKMNGPYAKASAEGSSSVITEENGQGSQRTMIAGPFCILPCNIVEIGCQLISSDILLGLKSKNPFVKLYWHSVYKISFSV